ncbi:hypothetical protein [Frigidibacter mobilis]|uniref:hypothetical protein n=1 Tax=Frigidibacter mobilis TaxID=1335048 RepID=UPI0014130567|nr:hypothetical protein [Frigidibacter mobilis]
MTAQFPEKIIYQGEELAMCTEPLEDYFSKGGIRPCFRRSSTALWRRYIGSWEIVDDRLYLTGIEAWLEDGTRATTAMIFPAFPTRFSLNGTQVNCVSRKASWSSISTWLWKYLRKRLASGSAMRRRGRNLCAAQRRFGIRRR